MIPWVAELAMFILRLGFVNPTALDSVLRPKDSSEVPGFRLERVLS